MRRYLTLTLSAAALAGLAALTPTAAQEAKKNGPLELRLVANKAAYTWDGGGKTPAEYRKMLEDFAAQAKKGGLGSTPPQAPAVDLTLKIVNVGKEEVTAFFGGDPNVWTFTLKGPGVFTMPNTGAFTLELRMPKGQPLKPGDSIEIPVKKLMDGHRGAGRLLYWTEPGEYTLSATYTLSDAKGRKGPVLQSEPVKITVAGKK
jgi:hypothetical protein